MNIKVLIITSITAFLALILVVYFFVFSSNGLPKSCDEIDLTDLNAKRALVEKNPDARKFIAQCDLMNATRVGPTTGSDSKVEYPF